MKRALCMGINDYKGKGDLNGCINDARNWAKILKDKYNFEKIDILIDRQVTVKRVVKEMKNLARISKAGDHVCITYSGHGSNVPDRYPFDEADGRDETLYVYDGHLFDDDIRVILDSFDKDVKITFISDCCHSGTITRSMIHDDNDEKRPIARYYPPEEENIAMEISKLPVMQVFAIPEENMNEVLITGCNAVEYSYDAYINGKPTGVMTHHAINILEANPKITYKDFYEKLRKFLPSARFRQTPQLEGRDSNKNSIMFE